MIAIRQPKFNAVEWINETHVAITKGSGMTKLTIDPGLSGTLSRFAEPVELCDESGKTVGYFHPATAPGDAEPVQAHSPFTDEELERRRQQRTGRPLSEILDRLARS